jgi:glycine oxidase
MGLRIGIAGAGLVGRLAALALARAEHDVTLFEANDTLSPTSTAPRAAAWTSAGMLSPIAEMETGGEAVRRLGERSLALWQEIDGYLRAHAKAASDSESGVGLQLQDSLMVCHGSDLGSAQRVLRLLDGDNTRVIKLAAEEAFGLAPGLKAGLHCWRLIGEGHLYPALAMQNLTAAVPQVHWRLGEPVRGLKAGCMQLHHSAESFDWVIDARGTGAAGEAPVRGVRGEVIVLSAPGFELHRAVRLLHPRWRVYIVPRPDGQLVVGATEIESEDRSPISVQSTMELLSAAFSIFPSLAEARILWTDVNLRPATPDNLPWVSTEEGLIRINGMFRHGWLLAPAVIEKALSDANLC